MLRILPTVGIILLCGVCSALSQKHQRSPDPVLVLLQAQLERELRELELDFRIEIPAGNAGKSLILRYKTRKYMVYPSVKGRIGSELEEREGPADEGILLRVHVQKEGEVNQAVLPQTIRDPYWTTYLNVYPVGGSKKQIYLALSYRGLTDKRLISKIQKIAEQAGADQPATAPESKQEGKEKARPDSEERPQ